MRSSWALLFGLMVGSCSSPATGTPTFPDAPLATATTSMGYRVDVRTAPNQPPIRGAIEAMLTVTDAQTSAPVDGLALTVVPWMPAMGHGASVDPVVAAQGGGEYLVSDLVLPMPGTWELRVSTCGTDVTAIPIDVQ